MATTDTAVPARTRREELLHRFEGLTEWPLLFLAILVVPILAAPVLTNVSSSTEGALETTFWIIWAVFAADLAIRVYLVEERASYLVRHWYDVLAVAAPGLELALSSLAILRSARLLRLLRLVRVFPFAVRALSSGHRVLVHRGLQYILLAGVATVFAGAGLVLAFERDGDGTIDDYGTALWWAATTITTVGYGDAVPQTPEGRGVAVLMMFVGIAFFSWITANVAAFLVEYGGGEEHGVTTQDLMRKLESLEGEIRMLRAGQSDVKDASGSEDAFLD